MITVGSYRTDKYRGLLLVGLVRRCAVARAGKCAWLMTHRQPQEHGRGAAASLVPGRAVDAEQHGRAGGWVGMFVCACVCVVVNSRRCAAGLGRPEAEHGRLSPWQSP